MTVHHLMLSHYKPFNQLPAGLFVFVLRAVSNVDLFNE